MTDLGYHGSNELKARFTAHVENHRKMDAVMQGGYGHLEGEKWKGCAVACSLRSLDEIEGRVLKVYNDSHADLAKRLGIPLVLARLEDRIFEGMPAKEAALWPTLFARAIPVGADLSLVWPRLAHWMLGDETAGVIRFTKSDKSKAAIYGVVEQFAREIAGDRPSQWDWQRVRSAAAAAAAYAADAAYDAAYAAAAAAAAAAAYAAYAAAPLTRQEARQKHYILMGEKLLHLMAEAPVKK